MSHLTPPGSQLRAAHRASLAKDGFPARGDRIIPEHFLRKKLLSQCHFLKTQSDTSSEMSSIIKMNVGHEGRAVAFGFQMYLVTQLSRPYPMGRNAFPSAMSPHWSLCCTLWASSHSL